MQLIRYVMNGIDHIMHGCEEFGNTSTHLADFIISCCVDFYSEITVCHLRDNICKFFYRFDHNVNNTFNNNGKDQNTNNSYQKHNVSNLDDT